MKLKLTKKDWQKKLNLKNAFFLLVSRLSEFGMEQNEK
jgi:hypothetical protein